MSKQRCVLVIDESLPKGLAANAAAVLSITLGHRCPEIVAHDLSDQAGRFHAGLVNITVPVLGASRQWITEKRNELFEADVDGLVVVDFSEQCQIARSFEEYKSALANFPTAKLIYLGIALYGSEKKVRKQVKSLSLLR